MAVDMINQGVNGVNKANNNATSKSKTDENKPVSKTVIGASLVGLAALASIGIYLATRGRGKCNVKPQEVINENTVNKFENIINEFKQKHSDYADIEPTITTLKNGKTKIEFNKLNKLSENVSQSQKEILVLDKDSKLENLISITKNGNYKEITTFTDISKEGWKKSINITKSKVNQNGTDVNISKINVEKNENNKVWRHLTTVKKSENVVNVIKTNEAIPAQDTRGSNIATEAILKDGKPDIVHQNIADEYCRPVREFAFRPGKTRVNMSQDELPFPEELNQELCNVAFAK